MADFTENLPQEQTQDARNQGSGFGQAFLRLAQGVSDGADFYANAKSAQAHKQQLEAKKKESATENSVFAAAWKDRDNAQIPQSATDVINKMNVPGDVERRFPGFKALNTDAAVSDIIAHDPSQAATAFKAMKEAGLTHVLFGALETEAEIEKNRSVSFAKQHDEMVTTGRQFTGNPDLPEAEALLTGAKIMQAQFQNKMSAEATEAALKKENLSTAQKTQILKDRSEQVFNSVNTALTLKVNPFIDNVTKMLYTASQQPEFEKNASEITKQVPFLLEQVRTQLKATPGLTQEGSEQIDKTLNAYGKTVTDLVSGDLSDYKLTVQSADKLKAKLNLDNAAAYPLLTQLKAAGIANPGQFFDSLSPATLNAISNEIKGIKIPGDFSSPEGMAVARDVIAAGKGKLNLENIPASGVADRVRGVLANKIGAEEYILSGKNTDRKTQDIWFNSTSNVVNWSRALTPQTGDPYSLLVSSKALFTPNTRAMIQKFSQTTDQKEKGEALLTGTRAVAITTIDNVNAHQKFGLIQPVSVVYDDKAGQYIVSGNPRTRASDPISWSKARETADAGNLALEHLAQTDGQTKDMPAGATTLSRKSFWATGDASRLQNASGQPLLTPHAAESESGTAAFKKRLNDLSARVREGVMRDNTTEMVIAPETYSGNEAEMFSTKHPDVAVAQSSVEGGRAGLENEAGAVGKNQIIPKWFPQYDAEKLKNDDAYNDKARDEIMTKALKKYKGNLWSALAEYHGGPDQSIWGKDTFNYVRKIMEKAGVK